MIAEFILVVAANIANVEMKTLEGCTSAAVKINLYTDDRLVPTCINARTGEVYVTSKGELSRLLPNGKKEVIKDGK